MIASAFSNLFLQSYISLNSTSFLDENAQLNRVKMIGHDSPSKQTRYLKKTAKEKSTRIKSARRSVKGAKIARRATTREANSPPPRRSLPSHVLNYCPPNPASRLFRRAWPTSKARDDKRLYTRALSTREKLTVRRRRLASWRRRRAAARSSRRPPARTPASAPDLQQN